LKKLLSIALLMASATASATSYDLQVLNSLSGTGDSHAYALNDSGQVVGQSYNSATGAQESVIWNNGTATALGVDGIARGINNSGTVVGETGAAKLTQADGYAYSWTAADGISYLGTLGGTYSGAYDINEAGVVTGISYTPTENLLQLQGFIYDSGTMSSLGTVSNPNGYSRGHGINDSNEIVGRTSVDMFNNSEKHMTYWDGSQNLNQNPTNGTYSTGQQINNSGTIVGNGRQAATGNTQYGMVWDSAGNLLNVFGDFTDGSKGSRAWSINDAGVIVGWAKDASNAKRAMISYDGINMVDLNTVVDLTGTGFVSLDEAYDINANGQVVGIGTLSDGSQGAFMISAIPVPAAVWLFGSALAGLGWMRRRKA